MPLKDGEKIAERTRESLLQAGHTEDLSCYVANVSFFRRRTPACSQVPVGGRFDHGWPVAQTAINFSAVTDEKPVRTPTRASKPLRSLKAIVPPGGNGQVIERRTRHVHARGRLDEEVIAELVRVARRGVDVVATTLERRVGQASDGVPRLDTEQVMAHHEVGKEADAVEPDKRHAELDRSRARPRARSTSRRCCRRGVRS